MNHLWYASKDVSFILGKNGEYNLKYIFGSAELQTLLPLALPQRKTQGQYFGTLYPTHFRYSNKKRISPEKQKPIINLVDLILAAKAKAADADVSELEPEIDELVYPLYALTPEEIKIVEGTEK